MRNISIHEMLEAFFRGMIDGYVGGDPVLIIDTISSLPGSKIIKIMIDNIVFTDVWQTTPLSDRSFGTTTLSEKESPNNVIWTMQYQGMCPKTAIPFLKKVLHFAYSRNIFNGGRGPIAFGEGGDYQYINVGESLDFCDFHGIERIFDKNSNLIGWHRYQGMQTWRNH